MSVLEREVNRAIMGVEVLRAIGLDPDFEDAARTVGAIVHDVLMNEFVNDFMERLERKLACFD